MYTLYFPPARLFPTSADPKHALVSNAARDGGRRA